MKKLSFAITVAAISVLVSCEKNSDNSKNNYQPVENQFERPSWWVQVRDTSELIIGNLESVNHVIVNELIDLTETQNEVDSLGYVIEVDNRTAIKIEVRRDTVRSLDGTLFIYRGVFYTEMDSCVKGGNNSRTEFDSFSEGDTLKYSTLSRCDTLHFFGNSFTGLRLGVIYDYNTPEGGQSLKLRGWKGFTENDGMGEGYMGFRYYRDEKVKYGWIKLDIISNQKLKVLEYAYQK